MSAFTRGEEWEEELLKEKEECSQKSWRSNTKLQVLAIVLQCMDQGGRGLKLGPGLGPLSRTISTVWLHKNQTQIG